MLARDFDANRRVLRIMIDAIDLGWASVIDPSVIAQAFRQCASQSPGRYDITQRIRSNEVSIESCESRVPTVGDVDAMNRPRV